MHTINHPRIQCLFDLSKKLLEHLGISYFDCKEPPIYDNLMRAPIWPVYTEIASIYGCEGHYRFKPRLSSSSFGIEEFVEDSVKIYDEINLENVEIIEAPGDPVKRAIRLIKDLT